MLTKEDINTILKRLSLMRPNQIGRQLMTQMLRLKKTAKTI